MSSSGTPTSNLGLNQWLPNDKPERVDFDSDNLKIDAAFSSIKQDVGGTTNYLKDVTTLGLTNESAVRYGKHAMGNVLNAAPNNSVAVGQYALQNTTGAGNVAIGYAAGRYNTSGTNNVAVGHSSLGDNTTGTYNTAIGHGTLAANSEGHNNVAIGGEAAQFTTTGTQNIAIGRQALRNNTRGSNNIAIGHQTLLNNLETNHNTAVGYAALLNNISGYNTAFGTYAGFSITSGSNNTLIGTCAGYSGTTSYNGVAIGYNAGRYASDGVTGLTGGGNNIFIGYGAKGSSDTAPVNMIVIGTTAQGYGSNTAHIGNSSVSSISYGAATGTAFTNRSDPRIKEDIQDADLDTCVDSVKNLPLHYFKYKDFVGNEGDQHVLGFLSTEFSEVLPKAVHRNTMTFDERDEDGNVIYETKIVDEYVDEEVEVEVKTLKEIIDPDTGETHIITRIKTQTEMRPILKQIEKEVPKQIIIEDCESIDSSQLVPILWGAVQQLVVKVEKLEARINE